jgi:YVTN family beta-propeller protein
MPIAVLSPEVEPRMSAVRVLALLLAIAPLGCHRAQPTGAAKQVPWGTSDKSAPQVAAPAASAIQAPAERLYVSDEQGGVVIVIDPIAGEVLKQIVVGKRPRGLVPSPDGKLLYVAESGSPPAGPGIDPQTLPAADRAADGVGVVDLASALLLKTLPGGQDPENFALSSDGKALFIANEETAELSRLDLDKGEITLRVKVGAQPEGVSVHPDGKLVYVTSEEGNEVAAVDAKDGKVLAHIAVGQRPRAIAWSRDGQLAFVTNELDASVSVIDAREHKQLSSIALAQPGAAEAAAQRPMGIVRTKDGKRFYVSTGRGGAVAELDAEQRKLVRLIPAVGARPWGIALSPDNTRLYTANGPSGDITILELASGQQKHVKVGGSPWGIVSLVH